ncbi:hypothetical protein ACFL2V_11680 [Pseudomonadota bacterium]
MGNTSDIEIGGASTSPKGSLVAVDKGDTDYTWFKQLNNSGIFMVARIRKNMLRSVSECRE